MDEKKFITVADTHYTTEFTEVYHEEFKYNAPYTFNVLDTNTNEILCSVHFQEGHVKEVGMNGIFNEDLLVMVLVRLEAFQNTDFACEENELAIKSLRETLTHLRNRVENRRNRGVLGTNNL